jgi:polyphosphate glucokinase
MAVLGVDVGGTGIKGAPVDLATGTLLQERVRFDTPQPSNVEHVVATVAQVANQFSDVERVGVTFPGVVVGGVTKTAANVHHSWIDADAAKLFSKAIGRDVTVINDADAAGLAEMRYGAGRGEKGVVVLLTLGTGIGSAIFINGHLLPNTELGHLELDGEDAEKRASELAREREDLTWQQWAPRLQRYLEYLERVLTPDLFIIGGGASNKADKFFTLLEVRTRIVPAELRNNAGIVGAALAAS